MRLYKDNAVCANGAMYRKDVRGFLPELMEKIYKDRTIYKKKMLQAKQDYEKTPTKALEKEIGAMQQHSDGSQDSTQLCIWCYR